MLARLFKIHTPIATFLGLTNKAKSQPSGGAAHVIPQESRWKWLEEIVLQDVRSFLAGVAHHREIATNDVFHVSKIVFHVKGEMKDKIKHFFNEFDNARRVIWIKRIWPQANLAGICLDVLLAVDIHKISPPISPPTHEAALTAPEVDGTPPDLQLKFLGDWRAATVVTGAARGGINVVSSPHTRLFIEDDETSRTVELQQERHVLGKEGDITVQGHFVSRRHLELKWQDGKLMAQDISTNGCLMNEVSMEKNIFISVPDKAVFCLGTRTVGVDDVVNDVAKVTVNRIHEKKSVDSGGTPVKYAPGSEGTPVHSPSLLKLKLADRERDWEESVSRLPCCIGREGDTRIPEKNLAVSRRHLVITQIEANGVQVTNSGSRGSFLNGVLQEGSFSLAYNTILVLGGKTKDDEHNPVELQVSPGDSQGGNP